MLKCPTDAPATLTHLFDYQLTVLNTIRIHDEQLELNNRKVLFLLIFQPVADSFLDPRRAFGMGPPLRPQQVR